MCNEKLQMATKMQNSYFRGLIFTRIEDHGPDITFNFSNLDETQALTLVVQAFTLIGVGTGSSRSTLSEESNLFGPMPVSSLLINSLMFPFNIDDQSSSDERIRKSGRSCAFIFLVTRQMKHYDELRDYLVDFMANWVKNSNALTEESIKKLLETIQDNQAFNAKNTDSLNTVNLSGSDEELKSMLLKQSSKIVLLENLVSMDSFSKALLNMYETNSAGGTLDQLAKMAGMSRIMIGWNLRKYVKAGILKLENNQIEFLS